MDEKIIYLNGSFMPESEAKVSVLDSGFNAGDGVYDVTRTFGHEPFKLKDHIGRLYRSLRYTRIDPGLAPDEMEHLSLEVLDRNKPLLKANDEYAIWQVVTRGLRSSRGNRVKGSATVAIYCINVNFVEFARHYVEGAVLVIPSTRRIPPQCLEPKAKVTNKMNHNIAAFEARQVDPHAIPLMLDLDGNVSESNVHNFFLVSNGRILTPGNKNVLDGITKETLSTLAEDLGIDFIETNLTPYDIYNAEEAFLASTSPTIVPVKKVSGVTIGQQVPGAVTLKLIHAWNRMVGIDIVKQALGHLEGDEREQLLRLWKDKTAL
jgi:branched-chain amino acid aminotransferase